MMYQTVLASLVFAGIAVAGPVDKRQGSFKLECDGLKTPEFSDCDKLSWLWADGSATFHAPSGGNVLYWAAPGNCVLFIDFWDKSYTVTGTQVKQAVIGVKDTCQPAGLGGRYNIGLSDNANHHNKMGKKRGLTENDSAYGTEVIRSVNAGEERADTGCDWGVHSINAKPSGIRHKSVTNTTSFSTSISATLDGMLSASVGTEISHSKTWESGDGRTITINCNSNEYGQVYFQAFAEVWQGALVPSGKQLIITKPMVNSDKTTAGYYQYNCFPKK